MRLPDEAEGWAPWGEDSENHRLRGVSEEESILKPIVG